MRIDVFTVLPEYLRGPLESSIVGRARAFGLVDIRVHDIRDKGEGRHRSVDDSPFGGGPGMVMMPGPLFSAVEAVDLEGRPLFLLDPGGERFTQELARDLSKGPGFGLLCGRYEGVDERVREHLVNGEISIGDYVLAGGDAPALVMIEAVTRLLPGVLGNAASADDESFSVDLLEYPQYTRPASFRGWEVPEVLRSGDHAAIERWRREQAVQRTQTRRPDLLAPRPSGNPPTGPD
jgi:tRNA (guanine37-N1)-methyltransferase